MKWNLLKWTFGLAFLAGNAVAADDFFLPAGTLLRCTLDEPNLSSKTAEEGDPLICRTNAPPLFGRAIFPRGAYLMGRLSSYKEPGRFWGKGNLRVEFDRIGLPNTDLPVSSKVISVRGHRVNRRGDIVGGGHPKRDLVEWLLPPLWPWKVLSLPARGPRPTLKGEVPITVRLMDSIAVPQQISDSSRRSSVEPPASRPSPQPVAEVRSSPVTYLPPSTPAVERQSTVVYTTPLPAVESDASESRQLGPYALLAFKNGTIYAATDYWVDRGRLTYVLSDGSRRTGTMSDVDLDTTTRLNAERGVRLTLLTEQRRKY
jgi:hypothetical protein